MFGTVPPQSEADVRNPAQKWLCVHCKDPMPPLPKGGNPGLPIRLRDLDAMVESSIRLADSVLDDKQSIKGEKWYMRQVLWLYRPYILQIAYHVEQDKPEVLLFSYMMEPQTAGEASSDIWHPLVDTEAYRKLLRQADQWRRLQP
jgi:hypothetical protein